jgi:hypothetical protein
VLADLPLRTRGSALVNLYGRRLRQIAPDAVIIACGQKRSNDMAWSEKVIDLAGDSFDVLGVHNYEYESDLFESSVRRIRDYLFKLRDYVRVGAPRPQAAVLEWNLSRTYDWRAGLHAAAVTVSTITAGLRDAASLEEPNRIEPRERAHEYGPDLTIDLEPYTVAVVEIVAK